MDGTLTQRIGENYPGNGQSISVDEIIIKSRDRLVNLTKRQTVYEGQEPNCVSHLVPDQWHCASIKRRGENLDRRSDAGCRCAVGIHWLNYHSVIHKHHGGVTMTGAGRENPNLGTAPQGDYGAAPNIFDYCSVSWKQRLSSDQH
jgi:hypothetical protein